MLKLDQSGQAKMEADYPGIAAQIQHFEEARIPPCPHCRSNDTAQVNVGIIGRTINLATATTEFHLIPNDPKPGNVVCNAWGTYSG